MEGSLNKSAQAYEIDGVKNVTFSKEKYGGELLIDVAWIHEMPSFEKSPTPYRLDFYDITLISGGTGTFWLDNEAHAIKPNQVFFTSPGQVRRWFAKDLDGICLFFPAKFLLEHFNDSLFLHRLRYFHTNSGPFSLEVTTEQEKKLQDRLAAMHAEIADLKDDSPHLLRAIAYEILVNLNRWFAAQNKQQLDSVTENKISKFRSLIESEFRRKLSVHDYANLLGLTPGHLNYLCNKHLGQKASTLIHDRLLSEACRMLVHSEHDIGLISRFLGFKDPSYFSRFFKRHMNFSPLTYRNIGRQRLSYTTSSG